MTCITTNTHRKDTAMPIPEPPGDDWASTPFPTYTAEEEADIVRRSPTADVARDLGITLESRSDGSHIGACPWCRQRQFHVRADQTWTCYACAEAGRNSMVLVAKMRDLWRPDAIQWLDWRLSGGTTRTEETP